MIDRYLLGLITGWVSLGGGWGLWSLMRHFEAQPRIPKSSRVPQCAEVSAGGYRCEQPIGHEATSPHGYRIGSPHAHWWSVKEGPPPAPRNTIRYDPNSN
jgi:hypothetical protein